MKSLAYNIDALLQTGSVLPAQGLAEILPELINILPQYRHLAITRDTSLKLDPETAPVLDSTEMLTGTDVIDNQIIVQGIKPPVPIEINQLKVAGRFWKNPRTAYREALQGMLTNQDAALWVTNDATEVLPVSKCKTLLFSSAKELLNTSNGPKKRLGKISWPGWTAASAIIVSEPADKSILEKADPGLEGRVKFIYPALEEPVPAISWSEQEQLKLRYTSGRDFFLYVGELSEEAEIIHLLKAYSLVKKWLMTGMPLILAGPSSEWTSKLDKLLLNYKYRADVSVYRDLPVTELKELVAGAYTLVHPAPASDNAFAIQWAFSAGTPVIACNSFGIGEFTRDAVQLIAPGDQEQLAHGMMLLYKDEHLRSNLIARGRERVEAVNRQQTLGLYKSVILGLLEENG